MSAFFFGSAERQLFGFHHAPRGTPVGAVVICASWGSEYQYAHRALRVLATRLAERGLHVLRFDYSGTGDSWGDTSDADVSRWTQDASLAIQELRAISSVQQVSVVGLRLGALVAAIASSERADVRRVAMWDPVHDGPEWAQRMQASTTGQVDTTASHPVEFGNRLVSPALLRQFLAVGPDRYPGAPAEQVLLLHTIKGEPSAEPRLRHIRNLEHRDVTDVSPWLEDPSIWSGLVPTKAIDTLCDWIAST